MTSISSTISTLASTTTYSKSSSSSASASTDSSSVAASSYELYTQTIINPVNAVAQDSTHLGYLDKNKTALEVQGTITRQDTTNYFTFAFRKGDTMKLATNVNKGIRVQIMDASGTRVLADSGGNNATLKKAYQALKDGTSDFKTSTYVLKVSYDTSANKTKTLNYDLTLRSGSTYKAKYKTFAKATTIYNTLLEGGDTGTNYSQSSTAAALLKSSQDGEDINILDYLS